MATTLTKFFAKNNIQIPLDIAEHATRLIVAEHIKNTTATTQKHHLMPKRPVSAYQRWLKDNRKAIADTISSDLVGKDRNHAILQQASKLWAEIKPEALTPYTNAFIADQTRYQKEKLEFLASVGSSVEVPVKRGRGRPKGSKNKPKVSEPLELTKVATDRVAEVAEVAEVSEVAEVATDRDSSSEETPAVEKKKRGRPKGSKNKPKVTNADASTDGDASDASTDADSSSEEAPTPDKKKRGRPKGSKNKPKVTDGSTDADSSSKEANTSEKKFKLVVSKSVE